MTYNFSSISSNPPSPIPFLRFLVVFLLFQRSIGVLAYDCLIVKYLLFEDSAQTARVQRGESSKVQLAMVASF